MTETHISKQSTPVRLAMRIDRDFSKMTATEIEDLFRSGQIHPDSTEGEKAVKELASRDRAESKTITKVAYWTLIVAILVATLGMIGLIISFGS